MPSDGAGLDPGAASAAHVRAHTFAGAQHPTGLGSPGSHDDREVDVLIVSLGSTAGLRAADAELADSLRRAGASVALLAA
ncbi:MAG: hypothetical protein WB709_04640, partial [Solirubrobacteraceae bacterium]